MGLFPDGLAIVPLCKNFFCPLPIFLFDFVKDI